LLVNPLRMATDGDGDSLTAVSVTRPRFGTATLQPNGFVLYKPNRLFKGSVTDSFTVTLSDGRGGTTEATFTVRSFDVIAGTFQGLLVNDASPLVPLAAAPVAPAYRGRLTATMNGRASYSARLELDGTVTAFTGTLTGALQSTRKIKVAGKPATVTLRYLDLTDSWEITAQGNGWSVRGAGEVRRVTKSSLAKTANYTTLYSGTAGSAWESSPGQGSIALRTTGASSVSGRLPDGRAFTAGARLDASGHLSVYRFVKATSRVSGFSVVGSWAFSGPQHEQVGGDLQWTRFTSSSVAADTLDVSGAKLK
jgi:hypothetical protein